jgi:ADP-ribosylglycohydrolase
MIKDIFLGIAIGDAFGAGLEFQDRNWIRGNVDFTQFLNKRTDINTPDKEVFTIGYKEWDYTDDTEMSVAVVKAIVSGEIFTDELLVKYFLDEYNLGYKLKGYKRNGHGAIRLYYNGEKTLEEIKDFQRCKKYPGNAPPMRAIPLGLIAEDNINHYATINATSTHPHQKAIDASLLIARATYGLLKKNIAQDDIIKYCLPFVSDEETIFFLQKADALSSYELLAEVDFETLCGPQPLPKKEFLEGLFGLPSNSMFTAICALYIIKHSFDAFDALKKSIFIGGDVDSLAAITVGITAGKFGINSIPKFMIDNVEGKEYLMQISENFELYLKEANE